MMHADLGPGLTRYAVETRLMLDLVAYEVRRIASGASPVLEVITNADVLRDDLLSRIDEPPIGVEPTVAIAVHLFTVVDPFAMREAALDERVIVVFRNRMSHKTLLYPGYHGPTFARMEAEMLSRFIGVRSYGLMAPHRLLFLLAARLAERTGRYDLAFNLTDRSMLSPVHTGWDRHLCPIGVVTGEGLR